MNLTCSFLALPLPVIDCLIFLAENSYTTKSLCVALTIAAPLAWPSINADLAFLPKANKDGSKNANIINVNLDRLTNSQTTGEVKNVNQKIQMPMISLVNIPNFAMDTMEVDFVMNVGQTSTAATHQESTKDTSTSGTVAGGASRGWGHVEASATHSVAGHVGSSKDNTRGTDFSAKYEVHATAKQLPPAEGMAKFTQIMASVIEPITTNSEAGTV